MYEYALIFKSVCDCADILKKWLKFSILGINSGNLVYVNTYSHDQITRQSYSELHLEHTNNDLLLSKLL